MAQSLADRLMDNSIPANLLFEILPSTFKHLTTGHHIVRWGLTMLHSIFFSLALTLF